MPKTGTLLGTLLVHPGRRPDNAKRQRRVEKQNKKIIESRRQEINFLGCVAQNPGASIGQVRQILGINPNPGYATQEVLKDGGYIKVDKKPSDKGRATAGLFITPEGWAYLQQLQKEG